MRLVHRRQKRAVAEIISTLLLILIAIAAGAVVYTYIQGFVGSATQNTGGTMGVISIESFCVSSSTRCSANSSFYLVVLDEGPVSISIKQGSAPQLYFADAVSGRSTSTTCNATPAIVDPDQTFTCSNSTPGFVGASPGDTVTIKVVDSDGGTTILSTRAIS